MNFPRPSLPDPATAYPSQPYPQHVENQNLPIAQQSFGPYRVDQTSVHTSTWQTQTFCGPAASAQHHVQQPFSPRILCPSDAPFKTESASYGQPTSTPTSTVLASLAPPAGPQERTRKRKAPTLRAADWEPYKKRILELHIDQDIPLPKVKEMIQDECGFEAELRQYRSCITRWGKDKNVKFEEMQAIVRKRQQRNIIEPHKRGLVFEVRGNKVDRQKIDRWMKRHKESDSFLYAPSPTVSTPSAVECYTEPGSPALTTITVYSSAPSPDDTNFTTQSSEIQTTALSLTGILRSPTDDFLGHDFVLGPQSFPSLELSFIYILNDSNSIMNSSVQILYKKDEEKRLLSELVIADLAIPGNPWEILHILLELGDVFIKQGRYKTAENVICRLVEGHRSRLRVGSDDKEMLVALNLFANLRIYQKLYIEAESLLRRVSRGMSLIRHTDTSKVAVLHCLGSVAQKQNKLEEAGSAFRQAREEAEKLWGPKHEFTLTYATRLGLLLQEKGEYEEAEAILSKTLALSKETRGPEDTRMLEVNHQLAQLLSSLGRHEEAMKMRREELALRKKVFGLEDTGTPTTMSYLGTTLEEQGKYEEAEEMHLETLVLRRKVLGPEHPDTLRSICELGFVIRELGRYKEAEVMYREALVLFKRLFGSEHPDTLTVMNNIASVLENQYRFEEAEAVFRETLALRRKVLGQKHPATLRSIGWLRRVLVRQGKFKEAGSIQ